MKKIIVVLSLLTATFNGFSQFHHTLELGGSNFPGVGLNTSYQFNLCNKNSLYLAPQLGIGQIFPITLQFGGDGIPMLKIGAGI